MGKYLINKKVISTITTTNMRQQQNKADVLLRRNSTYCQRYGCRQSTEVLLKLINVTNKKILHLYGFRTSSNIDVYTRAQLDRRRLEEAHLKYCILQVYRRYPKHFTEWRISSSVAHTLDEITPTFFTAFSQRYACKLIL